MAGKDKCGVTEGDGSPPTAAVYTWNASYTAVRIMGRARAEFARRYFPQWGILSETLLRMLVFCSLLGVLSLKLLVFRKLLWRQNLLQTCVLFLHELPRLCLLLIRRL